MDLINPNNMEIRLYVCIPKVLRTKGEDGVIIMVKNI